MMTQNQTTTSLATATPALGSASYSAERTQVQDLVARLQSSNPETRTQAWLSAGQAGAAAVKPLAKLMVHEDLEIARAAKRALWKLVRDSAEPGHEIKKRKVAGELLPLLAETRPRSVRVEAIRMLSEIGGQSVVHPLTELLRDKDVREDARQALQRIPDRAAVAALKSALEMVPEDFKTPIASSLRARGQTISGHPCQKLVPTKQTGVVPAGRTG